MDAGVLPPFALPWQDVVKATQSDAANGLGADVAAARLAASGPNELPFERPPGPWRILARQFRSVLLWILIGAIALSIALGETLEAVAITVITAFTVILGFVQEYRAERAMEALQRLTAPRANVVRDGQIVTVPAREVVMGDVLRLAQGDIVAADARLIEAADLESGEASLTGESVPIPKVADGAVPADAALGDRTTMVYGSTIIARGRAVAIVTATGADTEVGHIGRLLAGVKRQPTPLEKQLARLGRWLLVGGGAIVSLIIVLGVLRGQPWQEMLLFGIALAVAAVPEALPAVVTISLAIGAQRMARRHALIRRLPAVETLGATNIICTDKTGTLTTGDMTATTVTVAGVVYDVGETTTHAHPPGWDALMQAAALCNDADPDAGDPTEVALARLAADHGVRQADVAPQLRRVHEEPFTSETQRMVTWHADGTVFAKGSQSAILAMCDQAWHAEGPAPLDDAARAEMEASVDRLADQGMRVLALATGRGDPGVETKLVLLGLVGIRDPPRQAAARAIATCIEAGIRPVLITGDHPGTARAIARELGFPEGRTTTGAEMASAGDDIADIIRDTVVYARVSPADKLRIVSVLQAEGAVVAMTGDGVNDAPALRQADIGVAMGITGTDVAKEAGDMTLADDDFATIIAAVEEGRGIFANIRKYLVYLLSTNFGELALITTIMLLGWPLPLTAVMILYVNLASDGLPALALAVDPRDPDTMRLPPRSGPILDRHILVLMVLGGLWSALANTAVFWYARSSGRILEEAMTMTFVSLVLIQFIKAYVFRSERRPITESPWSNKWLNIAVVWEVALLLALLYVPALRLLFGTHALPLADWAVVLPAALSVVPVLETAKWWERRSTQ